MSVKNGQSDIVYSRLYYVLLVEINTIYVIHKYIFLKYDGAGVKSQK